ncbi:hypothetical protein FQR65_LT16541 [Abscondita terminalis]|nr:hypothetical protein FQR65_LT16541 [Abscondita terminalis]
MCCPPTFNITSGAGPRGVVEMVPRQRIVGVINLNGNISLNALTEAEEIEIMEVLLTRIEDATDASDSDSDEVRATAVVNQKIFAQMETISSKSHELIKDDIGGVILQQDKVLVRNKHTDELLLLSVEDVEEIFGLKLNTGCQQQEPDNESDISLGASTSSTSSASAQWSKQNIRQLISCYARFENDFKSTKIKNEVVWKTIAKEIGGYTSKQCSDKFKYLKQKYIKKKDNMGTHNTGDAYYKFDYFNEFDDIFGKKPNVLPVAIATSLQGDTIQQKKTATDEDVLSELGAPQAKYKKSKTGGTSIGKLLEHFQNESKLKEENRQRRHEERMAAYNSKMDALLDKL